MKRNERKKKKERVKERTKERKKERKREARKGLRVSLERLSRSILTYYVHEHERSLVLHHYRDKETRYSAASERRGRE